MFTVRAFSGPAMHFLSKKNPWQEIKLNRGALSIKLNPINNTVLVAHQFWAKNIKNTPKNLHHDLAFGHLNPIKA